MGEEKLIHAFRKALAHIESQIASSMYVCMKMLSIICLKWLLLRDGFMGEEKLIHAFRKALAHIESQIASSMYVCMKMLSISWLFFT